MNWNGCGRKWSWPNPRHLSGERERERERNIVKIRIMSSKLKKKNETDKTDVGHIDGRKQNDEYSNDFTDIFFIFSRKLVEKQTQ